MARTFDSPFDGDRVDGVALPAIDRATVDAILQSMLDPLVLMRAVRDRSGRIIDFQYEEANDAAVVLNHTTREHLVGTRLLDLLPGHRASGLFDRFVHTVETGEPLILDDFTYPNEILQVEGHYDLRAVKVGDAISYSWRDVTDRVLESERYQLLAENTSDIVSVSVPGGAITWVSDSVVGVMGWRPQDLVGRPFIEFVHPDDVGTVLDTQRELTGGGRRDVTVRVQRVDGDYRWMSISSRDVVSGSSAAVVRVSSWRDANAEVASRSALVESERRFQLLAENASDVVMMTNPAGEIVWVSPSVADVLGWPVDKLVGTKSVDLIAAQDRELLLSWRMMTYAGQDVRGKRIRYRTASGDWHWMELHANPVIGDDGMVVAAVVGLRDCQAEVVAERALSTLSATSRVLAHADDERTMLNDMCQAAVDEGGYAFAWYARAEHDDERSMSMVAASRQHAEYLNVVSVTWGEGVNGDAPMGRAVRGASTVVVDDLRLDAWNSPWRSVTEEHGFRSVIVVPVMIGGAVDGVLVVYAAELGAFGQNEVTLFENLANEVEFGINRLRDHEQLVESRRYQNLLTQVIDQAEETIVVTDATGLIAYANPAARRSSGYNLDELVGQNPRIFQSGLQDHAFYVEMWSTLRRGEAWSGTLVNRRKNGEFYEEETSIAPIHDEAGDVIAYVAVKRDLSAVRSLEAALTREQRDRLAVMSLMREVRTGADFLDVVRDFARAATGLEGIDSVVVLLVTSDGEAWPVDVAGAAVPNLHVGDATATVDPSLLERSRHGAWSVAMDEPSLSLDGGSVEAWRARGFTAAAITPFRHDTHVTGLLVLLSREPGAPTWLGEHLPVYDQLGSLASALFGASALAFERGTALRTTIASIVDRRAFHPVFQPFVDLFTGDVVGYEALTRFEDGETPEELFAAARHVGLGSALEAACAEAAIRAARALPPGIWISLNFSPALIIGGTMATSIGDAGREVVIEITEHDLIEDYGAVRRAMSAIKHVRLAVDDAGAGFTSLAHIIELEPDFVKLDISIVHEIDSDRVRQSMAAAMCYFAAQSGATIIAEGVETAAEAETLRELAGVIGGRHMLGQGYFFGAPAPLG